MLKVRLISGCYFFSLLYNNLIIMSVGREDHSDGGDHQTHGGHRGKGRQAETHYRGHTGIRGRCQ